MVLLMQITSELANLHLPIVDLLAQKVSDPDFGGQVAKAWNNFVSTGQIWALIIGIVIGYVFRGLNRY